jgi:hypothetical protein
MRQQDDPDSDIAEGLAARIEQLRREYIEGTPPDETPRTRSSDDPGEPKVQMKLPL